MNAFKRYQSRIFWDRMEALDVDPETTEDDRKLRNEEISASSADSTEIAGSRRRTCSPVSQGRRSQDSGFSDSDRSECSEEVEASRRNIKNKNARKSDKNMIQHPVHTSTPKQKERKISLGHNEANIVGGRWDLRALETDKNEETLRDFLYTSEPPEDENSNFSMCQKQSTSLVSHIMQEISKIEEKQDKNYGPWASVKSWLEYIACFVDDETFVSLQSKSLPKISSPKVSSTNDLDPKILTSSSTSVVTKILVQADKFDEHCNIVCEQLVKLGNVRSSELVKSIEDHAYSFLQDLEAPPPQRIHQGNLRSILEQLKCLRIQIEHIIGSRLDYYIKRIIYVLHVSSHDDSSAARGAIATLTALGLAGPRAGASIARCGGVRALLTSLISSFRLPTALRASTLRALSTICSCPEPIQSFIQEDGPEILSEILANRKSPETEKTEATAMIVQITAPWTNALGLIALVTFADNLVRDLTALGLETHCFQTLLLATAAMNNISSSKKCVIAIVEHDALRKLVQRVKNFGGGNVLLMEQIASLIGNVAKVPEARKYLAGARVCVALVSFLCMRPLGVEASYRKLEETAKAALTRLCVDPEIAQQVVDVCGGDCVIKEVEGELKYTKSLRIASKKAREQIKVASDLV